MLLLRKQLFAQRNKATIVSDIKFICAKQDHKSRSHLINLAQLLLLYSFFTLTTGELNLLWIVPKYKTWLNSFGYIWQMTNFARKFVKKKKTLTKTVIFFVNLSKNVHILNFKFPRCSKLGKLSDLTYTGNETFYIHVTSIGQQVQHNNWISGNVCDKPTPPHSNKAAYRPVIKCFALKVLMNELKLGDRAVGSSRDILQLEMSTWRNTWGKSLQSMLINTSLNVLRLNCCRYLKFYMNELHAEISAQKFNFQVFTKQQNPRSTPLWLPRGRKINHSVWHNSPETQSLVLFIRSGCRKHPRQDFMVKETI